MQELFETVNILRRRRPSFSRTRPKREYRKGNTMTLNAKESQLVKDLKGQEELCIEKYSKYAEEAEDSQLTDLFEGIAAVERKHLSTLTTVENGGTPDSGGSSGQTPLPTSFRKAPAEADCDHDRFLCTDLLTTEKHASHLYDTCIFEFRDETVRQALNHIQKEEQSHGKLLYDYMKVNGMYEAQ